MAEAEERLEEAKSKEKRGTGFLANISLKTKVMVGVAVIFLLLQQSTKAKLTTKDYLFAFGIGFIILLFLGTESKRGTEMFLEPEALQICREWMQAKIDIGFFPSGSTFNLYPLSSLAYNPGNIPPHYSFGCDVRFSNNRIKNYQIVMSAFPPANPTLQEAFGKFEGRKETVIKQYVLEEWAKRARPYSDILRKI